MEIKLNEGFSVYGSDINAFFDTLRSMDECTKLSVMSTQSIIFTGVTDTVEEIEDVVLTNFGKNGDFITQKENIEKLIEKISSEDKIPVVFASNGNCFSFGSISYQNLRDRGWETELIEDVTKGSKMILKINGDLYAVSPSAVVHILNRASLGGNAFVCPSFRRLSSIAWSLLQRDPKMVTLVTREIGNAKTLIAMHSEKYAYIPQSILIELYDKISACMGNIKCLYWEVDHKLSSCYIEFPDVAKDFAETYNLPDEVVPGLYIRTSDSGNSSLTVYGIWRIKNRIVGADVVRQVHKGEVNIDDLIKRVDNKIFSNYRKVPEKLCELLLIDCPTPTDTIKSVFEQIDIKGVLGKKRCDELYRALCNELMATGHYTAYEIAMLIASVSDRCLGISNEYLMRLRNATKDAIFADYTIVSKPSGPITLGV